MSYAREEKMSHLTESESLMSSGSGSLQDGVINYGTRASSEKKSKGVG